MIFCYFVLLTIVMEKVGHGHMWSSFLFGMVCDFLGPDVIIDVICRKWRGYNAHKMYSRMLVHENREMNVAAHSLGHLLELNFEDWVGEHFDMNLLINNGCKLLRKLVLPATLTNEKCAVGLLAKALRGMSSLNDVQFGPSLVVAPCVMRALSTLGGLSRVKVDINSWDGFSTLCGMEGLESLYLYNCEWMGNVGDRLCELSKLSELKELTMIYLVCDFGRLSVLRELSALESLNLDLSSIDDEGMKCVCEVKWLRKLSMNHCRFVTSVGFGGLRELRELRELRLEFCDGVNDDVMKIIGNTHKELELLRIARCNNITDVGFGMICGLNALRKLDIHSVEISDEGMHILCESKNMGNVMSLDLSYCKNITDDGFKCLNRLCALRRLDISYTGISDLNVETLIHLENLENLCVSGCNNISTDNGTDILSRMKFMRMTSMRGGCV